MRYFSEPVETMSRDELRAIQFRKLKSFLEATYEKNPFYRDKFKRAGVVPEKITDVKAFREIVPFSDKKEFLRDLEDHPVYGRRIGVPLSDVVEFHLSSGTSGLGQEVYAFTAADVEFSGSGWDYHFVWSGIERGDSVAITLPVSITGAPHSGMAGLRKLGCKPFMIGALDGKRRLEIMHRFGINYFLATPVYLTRMVVTLEEMGVLPAEYFRDLKTVGISAGSYPLEWARKMEEVWGTRLSEFYACSAASSVIAPSCENGIFSGDREKRGFLHLLENHFLVEVLDPRNMEPVQPGEEGELVITTLDKVASPAIRFRTADKVRYFPHTFCSCGRPFDLIECGTIARFDDMIKVKGMNVWPQAIDEVMFSRPEVEEYNANVIVDRNGRELVRVISEFKNDVPENRKRELGPILESELKRKTGINMQLVEGKPGEVEHFEVKPKRLKDLRQESLIDRVKGGDA